MFNQLHTSSGSSQPGVLGKPGLRSRLDHLGRDLVLQTRTDLGQALLGRAMLALHESCGEPRQHYRMIAQYAVGPEIRRTTIQEVSNSARFPIRSARWPNPSRPARRNIDRDLHTRHYIRKAVLFWEPYHSPVTDVFCEIGRGDVAAAVVARTSDLIAFLDHRPVFKGHVLIAPIRHVDTLLDLPSDLMTPLLTLGQRVAAALVDALGAQGTFLAINNVVSQSVPHLHLHVVPRTKGDGLRGFFWPRTRYASGEIEEYAERLRRALDNAS